MARRRCVGSWRWSSLEEPVLLLEYMRRSEIILNDMKTLTADY